MHNTTPNKVATPLPPLKPANKGKTWPISAETPKAICRFIKSREPGSNADKKESKTAALPFIISIISTGIPAFFPKTLNVLVAPALPLPNSLTSILKKAFPIQTAVGIEPKK